MKISFIIDHFFNDMAGTENQLSKMIRGLASRHNVELISLRDTPWLHEHGVTLGGTHISFNIDNFRRVRTYRGLWALYRHLKRSAPNVVHTFFPVANILGVLVARAAGVETVVASRRDYGEWMNRRYLAGTKFANRFVSAIVTNSHEVKRLTERAEGFCSDRIHVIYNGMDARAFEEVRPTQELRRRLGLPQGTKVVVLVANYRPMKRHETLVAAARDVLARRHDVRFLLIGRNATPAKLREAFEAQVAELGLADYIRFTEATGDIREHLALCDVGVNCSQGEGLSNAIMEYMAAGLPCVVADSGGNPDLVTNGVTGLLFPLGDASALAAAIEVLLDDPERRALLGQAGRERVRRDMSLDAMLTSLEALYATLVSSAAKHPQAAM